jgi:hypothetical protein
MKWLMIESLQNDFTSLFQVPLGAKALLRGTTKKSSAISAKGKFVSLATSVCRSIALHRHTLFCNSNQGESSIT